MLKPQTIAALEQLDEVEWFTNVGLKDTERAIVLDSWSEAVQYCASVEWEDLLLEASNRYCEKLAEASQERFNHWNDIMREAKGHTEPLVERKIREVAEKNNLPKVFEDTVKWDIVHLAMEAEYADLYPPGFYASQAYWYKVGHFPCGWKGEFPEGTLIIF